MTRTALLWYILAWLFWLLIFGLGILNMMLVHPMHGIAYMTLSIIYYPPAHRFLYKRTNKRIPRWAQIVAGTLIIGFTLAMSDLMNIFKDWFQ